jgi:hypothetical protein
MEVKGYIADEDGDLDFSSGDIGKGETTTLHQRRLLMASKGEYKQYPTIGVGVTDFILDEVGDDELKQIVTTEFENDGMTIKQLSLINGQLTTKAGYNRLDDGTAQ